MWRREVQVLPVKDAGKGKCVCGVRSWCLGRGQLKAILHISST